MSPAAQDLAIEAFLGLMVLLLAVAIGAIIRMPPISGTTASTSQDEVPGLTLGWPAAIPPAGPSASPPAGPSAASKLGAGRASATEPTPAPRIPAKEAREPAPADQPSARRGRYVPRHVQGYVPPERQQGPPWGPADTPPGDAGAPRRP